ncbi:hypothetical protein OF83DRAFT_851087 [Amylostereum chailletii]|nr:hypothetical protein OF83DRAFT_851087 [Amylostereum chailletii]
MPSIRDAVYERCPVASTVWTPRCYPTRHDISGRKGVPRSLIRPAMWGRKDNTLLSHLNPDRVSLSSLLTICSNSHILPRQIHPSPYANDTRTDNIPTTRSTCTTKTGSSRFLPSPTMYRRETWYLCPPSSPPSKLPKSKAATKAVPEPSPTKQAFIDLPTVSPRYYTTRTPFWKSKKRVPAAPITPVIPKPLYPHVAPVWTMYVPHEGRWYYW